MRPRLEERKHLRELKWNELISRQDAYRFYIKLILGVNAFFYATTGAVLVFYLNQRNNYMEFFLLLPLLMGTVIGSFLIYATALQWYNAEIIEQIRADLDANYKMKIEDIPDVRLLIRLLLVFGIFFFIVAASISLVPWLRLGISLPPRPLGPHIGLLVFTIAGVIIVSGGLKYSCSKSYEYLERAKTKIRSRPKTRTAT